MKYIIIKILKNLGTMFLTKKVVLWALRLAAKSTKNKIDDNVINIVEAAYDNNPQKLMDAAETIYNEVIKTTS